VADAIKQGWLGARDYFYPNVRPFRQPDRWLQNDGTVFNAAFNDHDRTSVKWCALIVGIIAVSQQR
jgi:hypothetical protein